MNNSTRRGLRLAAALVTAGLTLTVPLPALAADDSGILVLTDSQADTLAQHVQLDPYGDGTESVDPQGANTTPDGTSTVPGADTFGTADTSGTDTGSTDTAGSGATLDSSSTDAVSVKANVRSSVEGVSGMAATVPVNGASGDYFTLHALGEITRRTADGKAVWQRDNASLYKDWQVQVLSPRYSKEPYPARIQMGFNAVTPFSISSDDGYATGDLTGDGVDDVVFTADVGAYPFRPFTAPDALAMTGTFVTVLDGATGKTLWSKYYYGAYNVTLVDKTLVVADSPYFNLNAPATSRTALNGIRFAYADGKLTPSQTWSYDAGPRAYQGWSSLTPIGGGLLAASWNERRNATVSPVAPGRGHTLVLDTADGSVKWSADNALYSRQLHLDSARGKLVALEQADPNDGVKYQIATYSLADGTRSTLDTRINALPLALEVGDLRGDSRPEYTVSEDTLDTNLYANTNTVRSLDGDTGAAAWSYTVKRDPANGHDSTEAWGLKAVGGQIIASYQDDLGTNTADNRSSGRRARLVSLAGNNGAVRWEQRGVVASQMWVQPVYRDGGWHLRTVDTDQNLRMYNAANGKQESILPLQASLSSGVTADVNGDGKQDLVVGGRSDGVWAYDGPSMVVGSPKVLWRATVPGQVHKIVKADVNGDGVPEIIVAADTATAVLDSRTGKTLATIDGGGQFVWTVTVGDINGDGKAEIVVPTDKVRAYSGTGALLWEYAAPASAGLVVFAEASVGDGHVYAQWVGRTGFVAEDPAGGVALNGKDGSVAWTFSPKPEGSANGVVLGAPMRGGTYASSVIPYADGHAVVYTWFAQQVFPSAIGTFVEIRDGRTGRLLHTGTTGGPWTLGNFAAGPQGLTAFSYYALRTYAANGQDYKVTPNEGIQSGAFVTGPGGVPLLVAGGATGFSIYDPSTALTSTSAPKALASVSSLGAREFVTGDLNGDGVDEVVSLNFDETGTDRMAALEGGGYYTPYTALQDMVTVTVDQP